MTDKQVKERFNRNLLICSDSTCCSNGNSKEVIMNEIEKMYENTIGKQSYCTANDCLDMSKCEGCCFCKRMYPPFTINKQIELIKWLSRRRLLNIAFSNDKSTYQLFNDKCTGSFCTDLATAIAALVQCELDFCTEEEKQQLKEILNDR